jgi:hypothetical protein
METRTREQESDLDRLPRDPDRDYGDFQEDPKPRHPPKDPPTGENGTDE